MSISLDSSHRKLWPFRHRWDITIDYGITADRVIVRASLAVDIKHGHPCDGLCTSDIEYEGRSLKEAMSNAAEMLADTEAAIAAYENYVDMRDALNDKWISVTDDE